MTDSLFFVKILAVIVYLIVMIALLARLSLSEAREEEEKQAAFEAKTRAREIDSMIALLRNGDAIRASMLMVTWTAAYGSANSRDWLDEAAKGLSR